MSTCHCCAERRLLKILRHEFNKKRTCKDKFSEWLNRKYGRMVILRPRADGSVGISIPCVLCRKEIEKNKVKWVAHDGEKWVFSDKDKTPISRPTAKQVRKLGFRFNDQS